MCIEALAAFDGILTREPSGASCTPLVWLFDIAFFPLMLSSVLFYEISFSDCLTHFDTQQVLTPHCLWVFNKHRGLVHTRGLVNGINWNPGIFLRPFLLIKYVRRVVTFFLICENLGSLYVSIMSFTYQLQVTKYSYLCIFTHLQVEIPPRLCNSLAQSSNCEANQEIENLRKLSGNYNVHFKVQLGIVFIGHRQNQKIPLLT